MSRRPSRPPVPRASVSKTWTRSPSTMLNCPMRSMKRTKRTWATLPTWMTFRCSPQTPERFGSPKTSSKSSVAAPAEADAAEAAVVPVAAAPAAAAAGKPFQTRGFGRCPAEDPWHFRGGPVMPKSRHIPERSCVSCGAKMAKSQLVRIASKNGQAGITIDPTGMAPGRGAYLCRKPDCWDQSVGKRALARSLRRELTDQESEQVRAYYQENLAPNVTAT
ncbi:MAG: YlxR family protein [SAR202 cluster bacterium]|nr:YlxR family protein [SAR202 cluster bacterium]MQG33496.1 YlxR family protein [SAR202 cluster bacterium]HCP24176.1 hypothetical protein [Dehalococcoidia bacterium]